VGTSAPAPISFAGAVPSPVRTTKTVAAAVSSWIPVIGNLVPFNAGVEIAISQPKRRRLTKQSNVSK
jgi:hypothetical protein